MTSTKVSTTNDQAPRYAGVGSRETPADVLALMRLLAALLGRAGWVVRSGAADGADTAFEQGADDVGAPKEIYLPWAGFNKHPSPLYGASAKAFELASQFHPAWERLGRGPRSMHARNCSQVLGKELDSPSVLTVCWTPDGCESAATRRRTTGGTAMAIVLSEHFGVPVYNLYNGASRRKLVSYLATLGLDASFLSPQEPAQQALF